MTGRKKKITKKVEKQILDALGEGQTLVYICDQLGITRMTEWNHRQESTEYRLRFEEVLSRRIEIVEDSLYSKAVSGDVNAQRFWLTNRSGQKWRNIQDTKIGGDGSGIPITIGVKEILVEIPMEAVDDLGNDEDPADDSQELND